MRSKCRITGMSASPSAIPTIHPEIERTTDSHKNIPRTSLVRIPTDFKIPISFVRSATQANMTFMMPIPDTTSTITATPVSKRVMVLADSFAAVTFDPWSTMRKSSALEGFNLWAFRRAEPISPIAAEMTSTLDARATIRKLPESPISDSAVGSGRNTESS